MNRLRLKFTYTGFYYGLIVAILIQFSVVGCDAGGRGDKSPWIFLTNTFSKQIFDSEFREQRFSKKALKSLLFAQQLHPGRYEFLQVGELVRTHVDSQQGYVAIAIDGWPMSIRFTLRKRDGHWLIDEVSSPDEQRRILELLGPVGLPYVVDPAQWTGGLAGHDHYGRPNGSVLVVVVGDRAYVDGKTEIPYERNSVIGAMAQSLNLRTQIAKKAHATYRPHVALALTQNAPVMMSSELTEWAFEAGAQAVQMLVRQKDGSPGWLGLGRKVSDSSTTALRILRVRLTPQNVTVYTVSSEGATPVIKVPTSKVDVLATRLKKLGLDTPKPSGVIIEASSSQEHLNALKAIASVQAGLPKVPVALEVR